MGSGEDVKIRNYFSLFNDVDIIKKIKINTLRWAGRVTRKKMKKL
jgi:hypothetical protein